MISGFVFCPESVQLRGRARDSRFPGACASRGFLLHTKPGRDSGQRGRNGGALWTPTGSMKATASMLNGILWVRCFPRS
jgi:hypothetical protein